MQFFSNLCRNGVAQCNTAFSNAIFSRFCVYCFYEAVDSIPSPEFHRSFASGRTIRVNFSDANGSTDLRWIQSKHNVEILSNHNKATKFAYFASAVHANCFSRWRTELDIFNIQSEKQQQSDDLRSPLMSAVYANCLRTENLLFMAYGTQDF